MFADAPFSVSAFSDLSYPTILVSVNLSGIGVVTYLAGFSIWVPVLDQQNAVYVDVPT